MKVASQLAQSVGSHIRHSNAEMTTLITELRESVTIIQRDMNVNETVVANVEERLNSLTELFQKDAHRRANETIAREVW